MVQQLLYIYILIFVFLTFTLLKALSSNKIEFATMLWVMLFSLGLRTLHVGNNYKLHPLLALIVLITLMIALIRSRSRFDQKIKIIFPKYFMFFVSFGFLGLLIGYRNNVNFGIMLNEFQNILIYLPISYVFQYLIVNQSKLEKINTIYVFAAFLISVIGLLEILITGNVAWQNQIYSPNFYYDNFERGRFSLFGTPAASLLIAFSSTILISQLYKFRQEKKLFFGLLIIFIINTMAIYLSGTRVAWLIWILSLESLTYLISKKYFLIINILFIFIIMNYLPIGGKNVAISLIDPFFGSGVFDTSTISRMYRIKFAIDVARNNPFGNGWGSSGWIHSDFIQIAANLGFVPAAIWVLWYLKVLIKAINSIRNKNIEFWVVYINFAFVGLVFLVEGVQVLTNFIAPMWFFWVLAEIYQNNIFKEIANENINPSTNI